MKQLLILGGFLVLIFIYYGSDKDGPRQLDSSASVASPSARAETFRLIHALENDEFEVARGLQKAECERMKTDRRAISEALGIHNERLGLGSIACLPESTF